MFFQKSEYHSMADGNSVALFKSLMCLENEYGANAFTSSRLCSCKGNQTEKVHQRAQKILPLVPNLVHLNPMHALPSCLSPSLMSASHLGQNCPSGPILSEIPTKTVPAFPSCSMYATFHAKQIALLSLSN